LASSADNTTSAGYALRSSNDTGNNTCVTPHPRHRVLRGRTRNDVPATRRVRAIPNRPEHRRRNTDNGFHLPPTGSRRGQDRALP
jgi:hypothetical protein